MKEVFYVRIVEATKGGAFRVVEEIQFDNKQTARETCERLQDEFDEDGDPKRVYLLDNDKVPMRAGRQKQRSRKEETSL